MSVIIFLIMGLLFFLGAPMAFGILSSTIIYLFATGQETELIPVTSQILFTVDSFVVLAVPFFILAAELMNESKITDRIFNFAKSLVGSLPGGLGHINVIASMIFAGMSGSCLADTSGLGKVEIKAMINEKYDRPFSAAVTASSAIIGPIIPPSIIMVIAAVITNTSVGRMLLGGAIPGVMMGLGLMVVVAVLAVKRNYPQSEKSSLKAIGLSFISSIPPLLTPVILVGGIVSGIFTPTEAAAVACVYALLLSCIFYRAFSLKQLFRIFINVSVNTGALLFVVSAATAMGLIFIRTQIPQKIMIAIISLTSNPMAVMFLIVIVLIIMGMVMEDLSLLVIMGPILMPLILKLGIDPVHFGVVMVLTVELAAITPPVGMVFYISCHYAKVDVVSYSKEIIWFLGILFLVVVLLVLYPPFVTFLPNLIFD